MVSLETLETGTFAEDERRMYHTNCGSVVEESLYYWFPKAGSNGMSPG